MRIISGKYKSRRIQVPANLKARPTTDIAREGLFNILNNMVDWEETAALDLFSGTGSVALEMVSRGCPYVVSVEKSPLHFEFICKAQDVLEAKELFPVKADAFSYLKSTNQKFDLIFADPPYDLPELNKLPALVFEKELLKPDGIFILEHPRDYDFSALPHFIKNRRYGSVHFSFFAN